MSLVEQRWRARQARVEDGLALENGEFSEWCGSPAEGYRADLRVPVERLNQAVPDGWTELVERCSAQGGEFAVVAGEASWEGAGFIALERSATGRLEWLLHLSNAEPFVEVGCDGVTVRAVSEEYPFRWEWQIPIDAPEELTVTWCAG